MTEESGDMKGPWDFTLWQGQWMPRGENGI